MKRTLFHKKQMIFLCAFSFLQLNIYSQIINDFSIPDSIIYASPHKISNFQGLEILPIWPKDHQSIDFMHEKDEFCDNQTEFPNKYGQDRWVKHISEPAIYVFYGPNNGKPNPAIVIYPGGGGRWISIDREGFNVAKKFNELGYTTFVVKYRTYPERFWDHNKPNKEFENIFLATLSDNQRALKIIQSNSERFNIQSGNIGVMGFSAGAWVCSHLTFASLTNNNKINDSIDKVNIRPSFLCLIYGVGKPTIDFIKNTKNKTIPPVYIVNSKDDPYVKVEDCILAMDLLQKRGVKCDTLFFNSGAHGWGYNNLNMETNKWPEIYNEWLKMNK